ncbi:hypothetical protein SAMN04244575_05528 [Sinorhizobium meliloti]|nr:hypothetical protein SAMN04244575_05528 [Sinorhizobium meliloti]
MRTCFEQDETGRIGLRSEAAIERDLGLGRIDAVAAAVAEEYRQPRAVGGTLAKVWVGGAAHDHHAAKGRDGCLLAGYAPADEASHGGTGKDHRSSAGTLRCETDQCRNIRYARSIEGPDAWSVIGSAIDDSQIFEAIEIASEGEIIGTETAVAAATMNKDHGECGAAIGADAGDVKPPLAETERLVHLHALDTERHVSALHPPLGYLVALVDVA